MAGGSGESVMHEIVKAEEALKATYAKLSRLETKLETEKLSSDKKKLIITELEEVRKLLKTNEEQLAHLRTHNRKAFVFAAALCFVIFTLYMLYVLFSSYL